MICAVSSLSASVGGGFFMFRQEQDRKRIKDIEDTVGNAAALVIYPECDYKGEPVVTMDIAPGDGFSNMSIARVDPIGKSFILPPGVKIDMYAKYDHVGSKLPYNGPTYDRCTTIKSFNSESGTPPT